MTTFSQYQDDAQSRPADDPRTSIVPRQARPYQGRRAGLLTRVVATGIDIGLVYLLMVGLNAVIVAVRWVMAPWIYLPAPTQVFFLVVGLLTLLGYASLAWSGAGRTFGYQLMGIRVVNRDGQRPSIGLAAVRAAACMVFPPGLLWVLVSGANRSLQDVLLRTSVIYDWVTGMSAGLSAGLSAKQEPTAEDR